MFNGKKNMKVRFSILISVLFLSFGLTKAESGVQIGINNALNSTWVLSYNSAELLRNCTDPDISNTELDYKLTLGYSGGLTVGYRTKGSWSYLAEINFSMAGQKHKDGLQTTLCPEHDDIVHNLKTGYLEIPLMVKFHTKYTPNPKFFMMAGPQIGVRVGANQSLLLSGVADDGLVPAEDKMKTVDLGLVFKTGAEIKMMKNLYLTVGGQAYLGLMDLNNKKMKEIVASYGGNYGASRNLTLGLQVGVHYVLDKRNWNYRF